MVRLVFRPYTQVRRTICTSVSLRASTRVSSGFAPLRHSSPSFGSRQVCSHSNPSQKIKVGRRCTPRGDHANQLPCALRVYSPVDSHTCQTPWSVFKTGRMGSPQASTGSTQMPKHAWEARAVRHNRDDGIPQAYRLPGALAAASIRAGPRPEVDRQTGSSPFHIRPGRIADPHPLPSRQFQALFDSFFKVLFIFPSRGTCSLSVSRLYLALDGIYRPIGAAFPNNPTRRQRLVVRQGPSTTGLSPSLAPLSRGLGLGPPLRTLLQTTIRTAKPHDFQVGLFPVRSPLLGESLPAAHEGAREANIQPNTPRIPFGEEVEGDEMRDAQADVPSA
ncbi:Uncharacterized protein Adt_48262 [Abeliophyllum distichum]|uniref:Uncharacterized protein n=1 Tax=Abeliophyllum distichum TaxID=126358 RepID=A0ABD1NRJ1_9LAMI